MITPPPVAAVEPLVVDNDQAGAMFGMSGRSWRRLHGLGRLPEPIVISGRRRLWVVAELREWAAARCPHPDRWTRNGTPPVRATELRP